MTQSSTAREEPLPGGGDGRTRCWVFDVDGSLIDSLTGSSLRPGTRDLLHHLHAERAVVVWWSAGGDDYAQRRARQFELEGLISGFYGKNERDARGHYRTDHLPQQGVDLVFVDDRPEDLPPTADVIPVSPYLVDNPHDRGLRVVAERARLADAGTLTCEGRSRAE